MKKITIATMMYLIFGAIIVYAAWQLGSYYYNAYISEKKQKNLAEEVVVWEKPIIEVESKLDDQKTSDEEIKKVEATIPESIDFDKLLQRNQDIIAWIYCPNTVLNYPIVQAADNEKYLRRDLDLSYSKEGTLFMECKNQKDFSDWNSIIYGHNMKSGAMFKTITLYRDQEFYEEHPTMYLYMPEGRYEIQLVMGCAVDTESGIYEIRTAETSDANKSDRENLLNEFLMKSNFKSSVEVNAEDKIIILSTCSYEYDNARYVLIGKLVEW